MARRTFRHAMCAVFAAFLAVIAVGLPAFGATLTWDGDQDGTWSTNNSGDTNWGNAGGVIPANNDSLVFTGSSNPNTNNNITSLTLGGTTAITFNNAVNANFTLAGNSIVLGGNISLSSIPLVGPYTHTISLDMQLNGNRTISTGTNHNLTVSGNITEDATPRTLTKSVTGGTLTLTGSNSFTGGFNLNAGTVVFNSLADTGTNSALGNAGTISIGSAGTTGTLTYDSSSASASNRTIAFAGTTGGATINNNSANAAAAIELNGTLNFSGAGTKTLTLAGSNTGNNTLAGVIANNDGTNLTNFTKSGAGKWVLSNTASTYTGTTAIQAGTLEVKKLADYGANSSIGAATSGPIIIGNLGNTGTLLYTGTDGGTTNVNRQIQIGNGTGNSNNGGATILSSGSGALVFDAPAFNAPQTDAANTGTRVLTLGGTNTGANEIAGVIANNGPSSNRLVGVTKVDDGTWTLSGTNTYTGDTTLAAGQLNLNNNSALGGSTFIINGGTLDNTKGSAVTAAMASNKDVTIGGDFTFGSSDDLTFNFSGTGRATTAADRTITNNGANDLTFDAFQFNAAGANTLTYNSSGGKLILGSVALAESNLNRTRTITGTGDVDINGTISNGGSSTASSLVKGGTGTLTLSGANTYGGTTTVNDGTLKLGNNDVLPSTAVTINKGTLDINGKADTIGTLTLGASTTTVDGATANVADSATGGLLTLGGNVTYNAGSVGFENGTATISANIDLGGADRTFTVGNSTVAEDLTVSGVISGSGFGISKAGTGALTLSGANTYSGATTLSAGQLNINNAGTGGTSSAIGTGALTLTGGTIDNTTGGAITLSTANAVALNGSFAFGGTQSLSFANGTATMGGSRTITLNGTSKTLTLGTLSVSGGTANLTVNDSGTGNKLVLGGLVLAENDETRTRTLNGSAAIDITGAVTDGLGTGADNLIYAGTNTLTLLSTSNSYSGTTRIDSGTLKLGAANVLPNSTNVTVSGGDAVLDTNGYTDKIGSLTLGGGTTGSAGVSGGGTLKLGGNVTYNATNNVVATISSDLDLDGTSRSFVINDGANEVDLDISGSISNTGGGDLSMNNQGGTLQLSGNNSGFTGSVTVNSLNLPVLRISHANALGTADGTAGTGTTIGSATAYGRGRLELTGNIDVGNERLALNSHLQNVSGNNSWAGPIVMGSTLAPSSTSGSISNYISADAGSTLTISGTIQAASASTTGVIFGGGGDIVIDGVIGSTTAANNFTSADSVIVEMSGSGSTTFSAANIYAAPTTVREGTLLATNTTGSATGTGSVTVEDGGTLGGTGTIGTTGGADVVIASGAKLAPGLVDSVGKLTFNLQGAGALLDISAIGTGGLVFNLGADTTAGITYDQIALTSGQIALGTLNFNEFNFVTQSGFGNGTYTLFTTTSGFTGSLGTATGWIGGLNATLSFANSNNDLVLTVIPEPSTWVFFAGCLTTLVVLRRRRRVA